MYVTDRFLLDNFDTMVHSDENQWKRVFLHYLERFVTSEKKQNFRELFKTQGL